MPLPLSSHAEGTYTLPLFETSDTHGYLADTSGNDYKYRLAYICDKVKDVRGRGDAYRSDLALLLDRRHDHFSCVYRSHPRSGQEKNRQNPLRSEKSGFGQIRMKVKSSVER